MTILPISDQAAQSTILTVLAILLIVASSSAVMADTYQARRKVVRYGKASKRVLMAFSDTVAGSLTEDDDFGTWDSKKSMMSGTRKKPISRSPSSGVSIRTSQSNVSASEPLVRNSVKQPNNRDSIFQISSSEDELNTTAAKRGSPSKRRKTSSARCGGESVVVYDDDSLQRHVAAEVNKSVSYSSLARPFTRIASSCLALEPHASPGVGDGGASKISNSDPGPKRVALREAYTKPGNEPSSQDSKPKSSDQKPGVIYKISGKDLLDKRGSATERRAESTVEAPSCQPRQDSDIRMWTDVRDSSRSYSPRASTTARDQSKPNLSTPPRRTIYSKLLGSTSKVTSPGSLDILSLRIAPEKSCSLISDENHKKFQSPSTTPRRTKLVDRLHHDDDTENSFESSSDASVSSREESDSDELGPQALSNNSDGSLKGDTLELQGNAPAVARLLSSQSSSMLSNGGPKVTYAHQRSHLTEEDLVDDNFLSIPVVSSTDEGPNSKHRGARKIATSLQQQHGAAETFDEDDSPQSCTIQSIHELREAGGNTRLIGETEAILDDIEQAALPVALKRSALIELITKLQEPTFCRQFVHQGLQSRLFSHMTASSDAIVKVLIMVAQLHTLAYPIPAHTLQQINHYQAMGFFSDQLDSDEDIFMVVRNRKWNIPKATQMDIRKVSNSLLGSSAWKAGKLAKVTARILALQCLDCLLRQTREAGHMLDGISQRTVESVSQILVPIEPTGFAYILRDQKASIQLAVSVLESCSMNGSAVGRPNEPLWKDHSINRLIKFLLAVQLNPGEDLFPMRPIVLRLIINLTNYNREVCEAFSTPQLISTIFDILTSHFSLLSEERIESEQAAILDNLILSIGILINLAECSDTARKFFATLHEGQSSYLDIVLRLFNVHLRRSDDVRTPIRHHSLNSANRSRHSRNKKPARMSHLAISQSFSSTSALADHCEGRYALNSKRGHSTSCLKS